jgi:hypothetical protein
VFLAHVRAGRRLRRSNHRAIVEPAIKAGRLQGNHIP